MGDRQLPGCRVLANTSEALRRAGRVREAAELIDPVSEGQPVPHRAPVYSERGRLDLLRGRRDEATALLEAVAKLFDGELVNRIEDAQDLPTAELWCGRPQRAYSGWPRRSRDVVGVDHPEPTSPACWCSPRAPRPTSPIR